MQESLAIRRKSLLKQYGFECDCTACKHNYTMQSSSTCLRIEQFHKRNVQSIRTEVMGNWAKIGTDFDRNRSVVRTAQLIAKNKLLLEIIGSKFM